MTLKDGPLQGWIVLITGKRKNRPPERDGDKLILGRIVMVLGCLDLEGLGPGLWILGALGLEPWVTPRTP